MVSSIELPVMKQCFLRARQSRPQAINRRALRQPDCMPLLSTISDKALHAHEVSGGVKISGVAMKITEMTRKILIKSIF
jgi:hypothetical protein